MDRFSQRLPDQTWLRQDFPGKINRLSFRTSASSPTFKINPEPWALRFPLIIFGGLTSLQPPSGNL
jgi:hypothetical protein